MKKNSKNMKPFITVFLLLLGVGCSLDAYAQQQYNYSQYFQNPQAINPAFSGIEDFWNINIGYRKQWVGSEFDPESFFLGFNGVFKKPDIRMNSLRISDPAAYDELETPEAYRKRNLRHGIGGFLSRTSINNFDMTSGQLSYAYHLPVSRKVKMAAGMAASFSNNLLNSRKYSVRQEADQLYQYLTAQNASQTYFDLHLGYTIYGDDFYVGYAATQLVMAKTKNSDLLQEPIAYTQHYGVLGYKLHLSPQIDLLPSAMIRYDKLYDLNFDLNLKIRYDDLFWTGVNFRNKEAIAGLVGFTLSNNVTLGYSFEQNLGEYNVSHDGTHEVVLGLRINNYSKKAPYFW